MDESLRLPWDVAYWINDVARQGVAQAQLRLRRVLEGLERGPQGSALESQGQDLRSGLEQVADGLDQLQRQIADYLHEHVRESPSDR